MKESLLSSKGICSAFATVSTVFVVNLWVNPSLAADPFRTTDVRQIGGKTERAFDAIFKEGNYPAATRYVQEAVTSEPNEPLALAMKASLAYTSKDWSTLETYAKKTQSAAETLTAKDALRGNLYTAVGHFLEGAAILSREGAVSGAPKALGKLRLVYEHLDKAEAISNTDPELNLLRGYMDLMLAVNLPFSSPEQGIERLKTHANPKYLAARGLALGYRDLNKYTEAIQAVNSAIQATPGNPELYYLKAQIQRKQGNSQKNQGLLQQAVQNFDKALASKGQLPASLARQIQRERDRTQAEVASVSR
ncbi:MAG: Sll0314/Alr1548 family TPR repeat-containing protein [Nostocaceae cyanobacterium]|nr:Sll0314/Alr1548 family TPR repeat-containing protein [Nostocaceae cyanobacterium]